MEFRNSWSPSGICVRMLFGNKRRAITPAGGGMGVPQSAALAVDGAPVRASLSPPSTRFAARALSGLCAHAPPFGARALRADGQRRRRKADAGSVLTSRRENRSYKGAENWSTACSTALWSSSARPSSSASSASPTRAPLVRVYPLWPATASPLPLLALFFFAGARRRPAAPAPVALRGVVLTPWGADDSGR